MTSRDCKATEFDKRNVQLLIKLVAELAARCQIPKELVDTWITETMLEYSAFEANETSAVMRKDEQDLLTAMLSVWRWNPAFLDDRGEPKPLAAGSMAPCMKLLHKEATKAAGQSHGVTMPFDKALTRLIDYGCIEEQSDGRYKRLREDLRVKITGQGGASAQLGFLSDMAATVKHNLRSGQSNGRFCATSTFENVPSRLLKRIERLCWEGGMEHLKEVDALMLKGLTTASNDRKTRGRAGVGLFLIARDEEA